ncbi:DUF5635 domain-containing protein [Arcanobacterium wilhelmae]|uniref:DUF5635 domain-containing protein n=1 Tax=Arcanobacterium wilhelmae TaxID=1803177 RepID=UPI0024158C38|nr:DUF5635 domain-containing protein [Arcanobacterium wilhelmae]WFN90391.1 DUF5635 domain-containing protein [Arcanobacterium wilhelmae]
MLTGFTKEKYVKQIEFILSSAEGGRITATKETQRIDFKEEAGRRHRGEIEPGQPRNSEAATKIADEVACMANTPGGGVLILGVEDGTGVVIGTELEIDWLRQKIYDAVDVAPDIEEREVCGIRVLVIYVPQAPEPVEDTSARLRWRVGDRCAPVDRVQWWQYRRDQMGEDVMASDSGMPFHEARESALAYVRRINPEFNEDTNEELLLKIGATNSSGSLTEAGKLLFSASSSLIELTVFDAPGGHVLSRVEGLPGTSLLEQISQIEDALAVINRNTTLEVGLAHRELQEIPQVAVREALLNAVIHRDWNRSEPIVVRWVTVDSALSVRSPGGFPGAITAHNLLSNRAARYPALADLFRAIGLVDKQGVGVDRMYQSMIALGHRPPNIDEVAGPFVETDLTGGRPVVPIIELMNSIYPEPRQRDFRIAIILYSLFEKPFLTESDVALALQSNLESARVAIEASRQTLAGGKPIISRHGDVWVMSDIVRNFLKRVSDTVFDYGWYLSTDTRMLRKVALAWLSQVGPMATSDLMLLAGVSRGTAKKGLDELVQEGEAVAVGSGRSSRYELAQMA